MAPSGAEGAAVQQILALGSTKNEYFACGNEHLRAKNGFYISQKSNVNINFAVTLPSCAVGNASVK